jgi:HEAT repeat protein/ATP/ADP translocase
MATVAQTPPKIVKNAASESRVGQFFKVKHGEGQKLLLLAGTLLAVEAGYWLGGNAVDALVFSQYGSGVLPWLLIGKGVLALLTLTLYGYWVSRVNRTFLLTLTTTVIVVGLILSWALIRFNPPGLVLMVTWTLAYVIPDLLVMQAWSLARQVFDTRQSKRLFPLITAGDIIGIVLGNFLTAPLAALFGAPNLLLGWAAMTMLAYFLMLPLRRKVDSTNNNKRRKQRQKEREQAIIAQLKLGYTIVRYYKMMWLVAATTALNALLYWILWSPYIKVSTESFSDPEALAGFFGLIAGSATLTAFFLSLFVLNRLFTRYGIRNFLMFNSTVNTIGFLLIVGLGFPFAAVTGFRFVQLVTRQSVTTSATQTLYNLVPPEAREIAGNFNQAVSLQVGIIIAGLVLLLIPSLGFTLVGIIAIILALFYVYITWRMRQLYRPSLVQLLKEGQQDFFSQNNTEDSTLFSGSSGVEEALSVAIIGLKDTSEGSRRLSAELLGKMGRPEAVAPLLKAVLSDTSPDVRRACIVSLSQLNSPDAYSTIAEALADPDPLVRAQAAAAMRTNNSEPDPVSLYFLRKALNDPNLAVRREAVLAMSHFGHQKEALFVLWEMGRQAEAQARQEAALGYGIVGNPKDPLLTREVLFLLRDLDAGVRRQAATSLSRFNDPRVISNLVNALDDESPAVREEAAASLARMRPESIPSVISFLNTSDSDPAQVAALRALVLARLEEMTASRSYMMERIGENQANGINSKKITPLVSQNVDNVLTVSNQQVLLEFGQRQIQLAFRMSDYLRSLNKLDMSSVAWEAKGRRPRRNPENLNLLKKSLRSRYHNAVNRLIEVVALMGNVEEIELAGTSLRNQDGDASRRRADAIETFENFGDPRLTPGLIKLLEAEEQGENALPSKPRSLSETLLEIWLENDNWLRACVLHVIGLFNLNKMRVLVEEALLTDSEREPLVNEAALEAQQRLDFPRDDEMLEKIMLEKDMQTLGTLSTMSRVLFLQKVPIFSSLSPEDLRRVAIISKERLFSPAEIICYEGDPGDELYIIVSGKVQVIAGFTSGSSGRILHVASEGEVLGEMAILEDIPRSATLRAYNTPVRLLTLGEQEFKRILRERPELAIEIIRLLSRWLRETNKRIQDTGAALDNSKR